MGHPRPHSCIQHAALSSAIGNKIWAASDPTGSRREDGRMKRGARRARIRPSWVVARGLLHSWIARALGEKARKKRPIANNSFRLRELRAAAPRRAGAQAAGREGIAVTVDQLGQGVWLAWLDGSPRRASARRGYNATPDDLSLPSPVYLPRLTPAGTVGVRRLRSSQFLDSAATPPASEEDALRDRPQRRSIP